MPKSVGIRMDEDLIKKLDRLASQENLDRSTIVRKLLKEGYGDYLKKRAAERYKKGRITISKAAEVAGITVWEMEKFLVEEGYKSSYSIEDLKKENFNLS